MAAPKLNQEVKAAVNEAALKRDVIVQNIEASLSALGQAISTILSENEDLDSRGHLLSCLGDATRLIAARRLILKGQLNKTLAGTLAKISSDGCLF